MLESQPSQPPQQHAEQPQQQQEEPPQSQPQEQQQLLTQIEVGAVKWNSKFNKLLVRRVKQIHGHIPQNVDKKLVEDLNEVVLAIRQQQDQWRDNRYIWIMLRESRIDAAFNLLNSRLKVVCGRIFGEDSEVVNSVFLHSEVERITAKEFKTMKIGWSQVKQSIDPAYDDFLVSRLMAAAQHKFSVMCGEKAPDKTFGDIEIPLYEIENMRFLHNGRYARLYAGFYKGRSVVAKIMIKDNLTHHAVVEFAKELRQAHTFDSRYIVQYLGASIQAASLLTVMELMEGGNLREYLSKNTLSWRQKLQFALEIAHGLRYLHKLQIVHSDLRTANVLLGKGLHCKLSDFGLCLTKKESSNISVSYEKTVLNSVPYMAPEILRADARYSKKSDVYAFGMILWELATQKLPYYSLTSQKIITRVTNGTMEDIPESIDGAYASLIRQCWHGDPKQRPSMTHIISYLEYMVEPDTGDIGLIRRLTELGATLGSIGVRSSSRYGYPSDLLQLTSGVDVEGNTALHLAAKEGDTGAFLVVLKCGVELDSINKAGFTPLHIAIENGHVELVATMIQLNADVNRPTATNERTPLHLAVLSGKTKIITKLVRKHAALNARDTNGMTPVHLAAQRGDTDALTFLLLRKANLSMSDMSISSAESPLMEPTPEAATAINITDQNGNSALHLAATENHVESVRFLAQLGANVNLKNNYGFAPLHLAALRGHTVVAVELVLRFGAKVSSKSRKKKKTARKLAKEAGFEETAQRLRELYAKKSFISLLTGFFRRKSAPKNTSTPTPSPIRLTTSAPAILVT